jgi:hypothetical protein
MTFDIDDIPRPDRFIDGQPYWCVKEKDYIRKDGTPGTVLLWQTYCILPVHRTTQRTLAQPAMPHPSAPRYPRRWQGRPQTARHRKCRSRNPRPMTLDMVALQHVAARCSGFSGLPQRIGGTRANAVLLAWQKTPRPINRGFCNAQRMPQHTATLPCSSSFVAEEKEPHTFATRKKRLPPRSATPPTAMATRRQTAIQNDRG